MFYGKEIFGFDYGGEGESRYNFEVMLCMCMLVLLGENFVLGIFLSWYGEEGVN